MNEGACVRCLSRMWVSVAIVAAGTMVVVGGEAARAQSAGPAISGAVTIVESAQEKGPVERATKDLQNDFKKVFGQTPKLVSDIKDAGPVTILIAERENVPAGVECATTSDTEAFAF